MAKKKSKGYFAKRKQEKARKARQAQWQRVSRDVETVSAGVSTVATVATGIIAAIGWLTRDKATSDREITRTDALNALSISAQTAIQGARTRSQRRQAKDTLKATERALESLALQRATAEADYAKAVYSGVHLHRSLPQPLPVWWPEGVS